MLVPLEAVSGSLRHNTLVLVFPLLGHYLQFLFFVSRPLLVLTRAGLTWLTARLRGGTAVLLLFERIFGLCQCSLKSEPVLFVKTKEQMVTMAKKTWDTRDNTYSLGLVAPKGRLSGSRSFCKDRNARGPFIITNLQLCILVLSPSLPQYSNSGYISKTQ